MRRVLVAWLGLVGVGCATPAAPQEDLSSTELRKNDKTECEVAGGISFHGRRRYLHGVNYAWHEFATDFGGLAAWGRGGVRADSATIDQELAGIAASGASVVRWWIFPQLLGDGLARDATGSVPKVTEQALLDLEKALELAERHDLYVLFTLFSFDAFRAPQGRTPDVVDLAPLVREPRAVEALVRRIVTPLVDRAATSRFAHRVFAWDLMNEPEWAVSDLEQRNMCSAAVEPTDCVSYAQMHWFLTRLSDAIAARIQGLPQRKKPLITIGAASPWEARNWEAVPQDFFQFHFYDHDYARGALELPRRDKPVIIGEFPSWGLSATWARPAQDATQITWSIHDAGFQGGLGWTVNTQDSNTDATALTRATRAFADAAGCTAKF